MSEFVKLDKDKIVISDSPLEESERTAYRLDADKCEQKVCEYFISKLSSGREISKFKIERRADEYLSLFYGNNNFLRVKYTEKSKWISFFLSNEDRVIYKDSPLFDMTEDKNTLHWKARIYSFDVLKNFIEIADHACHELKVCGSDPTTPQETEVCNYIKEILLEVGAREEYIEYRHYSDKAGIYYCKRCICDFKIMKKRANYILIKQSAAKGLRMKLNEKENLEFITLEDLKANRDIKKYVEVVYKKFESYADYFDKYPERYLE